jgi:hypothetical protein
MQKLYERLGIVAQIDGAGYSTGGKITASTGGGATAGHHTAMVNTAGQATSNVVDMKDHDKVLWCAQTATGASATATLKVEVSTSTDASDFVQLTGRIGTATAASASASMTANQQARIEVSASALQDNHYRYMRALLTVVNSASVDAGLVASVIAIGSNRFEPGDDDMDTVADVLLVQ